MVLHKTIDGMVTCSDWDDLATTFLGEGRNRYTCSYAIFNDGVDTFAQNGITGTIDYGGPDDAGIVDGADAAAVVQAAINALPFGGLIIICSPLTFTSTVRPGEWVKIEGLGHIITLGADVTAFEFLDVTRAGVSGFQINVLNGQTAPVLSYRSATAYTRMCYFRNIIVNNPWAAATFAVVELKTTGAAATHVTRCVTNNVQQMGHTCGVGINFDSVVGSYTNINYFEDFYAAKFVTLVDFSSVLGGCHGNNFLAVNGQVTADAIDGFKNITGYGNVFLNCYTWDWILAAAPNHTWSIGTANRTVIISGGFDVNDTMHVSSDAKWTKIIGWGLTTGGLHYEGDLIDDGRDTLVIGDESGFANFLYPQTFNNWCLNGSFEVGARNWTTNLATLASEAVIVKVGALSARVTANDAVGTASSFITQTIPLVGYAGLKVTVGAWVRADSGNDKDQVINIAQYDAVPAYISDTSGPVIPKDDAWHWTTVTTTITATTAQIRVQAIAKLGVAIDVDDILYVDGYTVTVGQNVPGYTPHYKETDNENSGTATFSGDGATVAFNIAHGLAATPTYVSLEAESAGAVGDKYWSAGAVNITVTFITAPPTGVNNVVIGWKGEI